MPQIANSSGPTLDQRRARHAWEAVRSFARNSQQGYGSDAQEYAREAKKLPTRIMAAGLGQALSFVLAKAKGTKPDLLRLHEHLSDWIIRQRPLPARHTDSLLQSIIDGDSNFLPPGDRRNAGLPPVAQPLRRGGRIG